MSVDERVMLNLKKCSDLFFEHYGFVYNIIISRFQKKPVGPLLEIEKAFSHLFNGMKAIEENNPALFEENIRKMVGHIERMLLDMYKYCFQAVIKDLEKKVSSCEDFSLIERAKGEFLKIRDLEIDNIGASLSSTEEEIVMKKEKVLEEYKKVLKSLLYEIGYIEG